MARFERAGPGSIPGRGTDDYPWSVAESTGPAKAELCRFDSCQGYCGRTRWIGELVVNQSVVGSTPTGHLNEMPAMLDRPGTAPVKRTKWVRVPPLALYRF